MNTFKRLSIATSAVVLLGSLGGGAFAQVQQGQVSVSNQLVDPRPEVVIDRSNFKQMQKDGLHLYPGEIVEIKVDHHLIYPKSGIHQSLDQISFGKRTFYRAREFGATGQVAIESGAVIPFYGLWALSALGREHTLTAVVDKQSEDVAKISQR